MITENYFIEQLAETLDCAGALNADSILSDIAEWDSFGQLCAYELIERINSEIKIEQLREAETVGDLFQLLGGNT